MDSNKTTPNQKKQKKRQTRYMTSAVPCCSETPHKPIRLCGFRVVRGWPLALGAVLMMVVPFVLCCIFVYERQRALLSRARARARASVVGAHQRQTLTPCPLLLSLLPTCAFSDCRLSCYTFTLLFSSFTCSFGCS